MSVSAQLSAADAASCWVSVALDVPLDGLFDYRAPLGSRVGQRVIVPFGRRAMVGMIVNLPAQPAYPPSQIKAVDAVLSDLPDASPMWLAMTRFAASYYQRPWGEVILPALPSLLRKVSAYRGKRAAGGPVSRLDRRVRKVRPGVSSETRPALNDEQCAAVVAIDGQSGYGAFLLHGVTGSGKTEVYLHVAEHVLAQGRQVLMLVPEINLTPQLEVAIRKRFEAIVGPDGVAALHSGLADGERLRAWADAVRGQARLLIGTRMAILADLPEIGLIIVDEEHDVSYKQQDGLRYSARDLAVWRANQLGVPVVLGSATPSLETWQHAERGQYRRLSLTGRARATTMPAIRLVDTRRLELDHGMSPPLLRAIEQRLAAGQQSLVFINRRGYAPVLQCSSCAWVSNCPRCTAFTVLHRERHGRHRLQCHHCGYQARVPHACPACGDQDLKPLGCGTQRVEERLAERFPQARIVRIDADSTRLKGSAQALFDSVHAGEVDILVGTQMVAKGHDFSRLSLVGVLNADAMLFAHDFRAPERLFAQLMQVSGRAGRHADTGEVLIQTGYPEQAVYQTLLKHDYDGFAAQALREREETGLPPFAFQALLTAQARALADTVAFLQVARARGDADAQAAGVVVYDPVPLRVVRVANIERAQLLVEARGRAALQHFLRQWRGVFDTLPEAACVRWYLEIDPLEI
jgi:primosomal protein N' (replication factor Y)